MSIPKWKAYLLVQAVFCKYGQVKFDVMEYNGLRDQCGDFVTQTFEIAHTWSNDHSLPLWGISNQHTEGSVPIFYM